ncbi:hypothetical protein OUZ56_002079 [Daphnia magna]|uniref:Uncharacterized protein n=1 Tax=Daphnia magna TaxID=35525 RepID=A0ABR0A4M8_9CRUS|nr:hypothetical protein OUZ56_002079 [Daphnia magna]
MEAPHTRALFDHCDQRRTVSGRPIDHGANAIRGVQMLASATITWACRQSIEGTRQRSSQRHQEKICPVPTRASKKIKQISIETCT